MSVKYSKWPSNISTFSNLRLSQKFTLTAIFGLKIIHLATLILMKHSQPKVTEKLN
jgi:hypothetical protein